MVARQVVDREQRAEDREQVEVEACSPSKRERRAGSAGHHVTGGRAGGRGEARQSPRPLYLRGTVCMQSCDAGQWWLCAWSAALCMVSSIGMLKYIRYAMKRVCCVYVACGACMHRNIRMSEHITSHDAP